MFREEVPVVLGRLSSNPTINSLDSSSKGFDDLADPLHFVELGLQLVDLTEDVPHARNFSVCVGNDIACAIVLRVGCRLRLLVELQRGARSAMEGQRWWNAALDLAMETYQLPALLNCGHDAVEVVAQCLETGRVQQQTALAGGIAGGARRRAVCLREGESLVGA